MKNAVRRKTATWVLAAMAAVATLGVVPAASAEEMAGHGVSLVNSGKQTLYVYTRYGAGSSCDDMRSAKNFKIKSGETAKVDSGDSKVCYCLALPNRTDGCPGGWQEIPAGGSLTFQ
jgi:hypothetical protein